MSELSILWSPGAPRAPFGDTAFLRDLRADDLIRLRGEQVGERPLTLADFLTADPATMRAREALFFELLDTPGLFEALRESFARLNDIFELQSAREGAMSEEQLLFSIRELEGYLDYLAGMRAIFESYPIHSELLLGLWRAVEPLCTGADYDALRAAVEKQSRTVSGIKSVTVGVNLGASLRPVEAGVVAVHDESYVSGDLISHLLRLDFEKTDLTCMAPLAITGRRWTPQEQAAMQEATNAALRKILGDSLRSWATVIKSHVLGNLRALGPLAEEWRFVAAATESLRRLRAAGGSLCRPTILDAPGDERVEGLYHPLLALAVEHPSAVVRNDLTFDGDGRLFILTGPNSGGKSVYLQAVGLCYVLLHLGLPLPADRATVFPVTAILTHFADARDGSFGKGRLEAECARIREINSALTAPGGARSLLLFDEALSGTNATEAVVISTELLAAYAALGVRGVWVTHFHDLCRLPATLAAECGGATTLATLSATLDPASHDRLFTITRGDSAAQSYAMDIARSFHLTREEILNARS